MKARRRWTVALVLVLAPLAVGAGWIAMHTRMELCGVGHVSVLLRAVASDQWSGSLLPARLGAQARAAAWPRALASVQAGGTPLHQAAVLMLRIDRFVDAEAPEVLANGPEEDRLALTAQLVRMAHGAQGTAEADIVRWAVQACRRHTQAEGCSTLAPRDVLALDPTDGTALLAQAAIDRAQRDALVRAAAATGVRFRDWSDALPGLVAAAFPDDLPSYLLVDLAVLSIGIEAARPDPTGWLALMHCKPDTIDEPARRADCQALAEALTTRSDSVSALAIGRSLATKLGWAQERLDTLKAEEAAAQQWALSRFDMQQPYACASVDALRGWMRDRARWGDLTATRHMARAAPGSPR